MTPDFLTHKRVKNDGLAHKYHIKDNHEAIVDRETWEMAQSIREANALRFRGSNPDTRKYQSRYPYSGIILCSECGNTYKRRMWIQGYPEPRIVYQCNGFVKGDIGHRCKNKNISEDILNKAICEIINAIYKSKEKIFSDISAIITKQIKIENVDKQLAEYNASKENIEKELDTIISQKSKATSDMLTKTIVQTFIQNIIVVDKNHAVIVLATGTAKSNKEISENRKTIINKTPLLEGVVHLERTFRPETLNYKVVTY